MTELPPVSIVIPTRNEEERLKHLLSSIKRQRNVNYEIIVADNKSEDKTRAVAKRFGANVVEGGLPPAARNKGAKAAKHQSILFIDADCIIKKENFLNESLRCLEEKKLGVATTRYEASDESLKNRGIAIVSNLFVNAVKNIKPHGAFAIFVKKNVFKEIGGFDESLRMAEDHDLIQRASKKSAFGVLPTAVTISFRRYEEHGYLRTMWKYVYYTIVFNLGKRKQLQNVNYTYKHK